jgi:hypothetical protein
LFQSGKRKYDKRHPFGIIGDRVKKYLNAKATGAANVTLDDFALAQRQFNMIFCSKLVTLVAYVFFVLY